MDVAVCVGIPYMKDDLDICETLRILSIKNICANAMMGKHICVNIQRVYQVLQWIMEKAIGREENENERNMVYHPTDSLHLPY